MIQQDGYAPRAINPMIGPPATTLVSTRTCYAMLCALIPHFVLDEENLFWLIIWLFDFTCKVRYGGKYAGLIVYEKQWWRLISPIAVHAGIIHLLSNVIIQVAFDVCVCVFMYLCVCVCTYVCVFVCACMHVCVYCVYMCMYVCVCVCVRL